MRDGKLLKFLMVTLFALGTSLAAIATETPPTLQELKAQYMAQMKIALDESKPKVIRERALEKMKELRIKMVEKQNSQTPGNGKQAMNPGVM